PAPPPDHPAWSPGGSGSAGLQVVAEAREVDRARVAGDEAPALLALDPGLDLDAIVGGHAPRACDLVVVAEDAAVAVGVEVGRGGAREHGDDADLVPAQVRVIVAVVGGDGADRLRHARLPARRRSASVRYRLPFTSRASAFRGSHCTPSSVAGLRAVRVARPSRPICEVGEELDPALPSPLKEAVIPAWLRTSSRSAERPAR